MHDVPPVFVAPGGLTSFAITETRMISRRTILCVLACSALTWGCNAKNDLVADTQSVHDKLIEMVGADTEVYSVLLISADKPGAGVTIATVRFKEGDGVKIQTVMLWGPPSLPAKDDALQDGDPASPVRVADIDFSDVAANVAASIPMLPGGFDFMSVSNYQLPIGREATWELYAQTEAEYANFPFGLSPNGDVVGLP